MPTERPPKTELHEFEVKDGNHPLYGVGDNVCVPCISITREEFEKQYDTITDESSEYTKD